MIGNDWDDILKDVYQKEYFGKIKDKVRYEYNHKTIFPPANKVFYALRMTPYKSVKVVILGQDPYHGVGEANGLCFSVNHGIKMPPSLNNIYKELYSDLGITRTDTDLTDWASQGVLLLNSVLTVEKDKPASHKFVGWEEFTDEIIMKLNDHDTPIVFILWGNASIAKKAFIDAEKHTVITAPNPSPLSAHRGFFGSRPFTKANEALIKIGQVPINWEIPNEVTE